MEDTPLLVELDSTFDQGCETARNLLLHEESKSFADMSERVLESERSQTVGVRDSIMAPS